MQQTKNVVDEQEQETFDKDICEETKMLEDKEKETETEMEEESDSDNKDGRR